MPQIVALRDARLSQREIAAAVGLQRQTVGRWLAVHDGRMANPYRANDPALVHGAG